MDLGLKGKKAIVTGGTKGIGRRVVNQLVAEGCAVAVCARNAVEVATCKSELEKAGAEIFAAACDVADRDAYKSFLENAAAQLGGVDIFVPNVSAGGGMEGEKSWYKNFEVDVMGTVRGCDTLLPHMRDGGAIVFVSTTAAVETFMAPQAYNALKAALITYGQQLAQAVAGQGVRVNIVSPGPVYFEGGAWTYIEGAMPDIYKGTLAQQPMGRMATPEEVANCIVFLASPAASWVTGINMVVDGGFTKRVQL